MHTAHRLALLRHCAGGVALQLRQQRPAQRDAGVGRVRLWPEGGRCREQRRQRLRCGVGAVDALRDRPPQAVHQAQTLLQNNYGYRALLALKS